MSCSPLIHDIIMSLFVINGISVILSDNSVMFICRLVEEVKDACSVTLEADDIYMNTRYCFHWRFLHKLWFFFFFLDTGISVPQRACPGENAPVSVIFYHENMTLKNLSPVCCFWFRYGDFVHLAVLHSRGGGHQEFTCNTVSTLKTKV